MTFQLLNRQTQQLTPWPRDDEQMPVGLDRGAFHVVEVIRLEPPEPAPGQSVQPADPVVVITDPDGEGINGTATLAWVVEDVPPPEPEPDFDAMATALRTENGFKDAFILAFAEDPIAAGSLTSRFDDFRKDGDFAPFLQSMLLVLHSLPPEKAAEIRAEFPRVAVRCHMPTAFLQALQAAFNAGPAPSPPG
jgi:hypothetical protein